MADGVATKDVYKVLNKPKGIDRAFAKLKSLEKNIVWWEYGSQPPKMLMAGDLIMSSAYNGRVSAAIQDGNNLGIVWNQNLYDIDYWIIPKGSKNKDLAIEFIKYASSAKAQIQFAENINYGPTNKLALEKLDKSILKDLPNSKENSKNALANDIEFWSKYGDQLEQRFINTFKKSN